MVNLNAKIALISDNEQSVSYAEFNKHCESIGKKMPERSLYFCLCKNSCGSVVGYAAGIKNKSVPVLLDCNIHKELLLRLIDTYKPNYLFAPNDYILDYYGCKKVADILDYSLFKFDGHRQILMHPDLALLLTTSGSTGSPKFVRQSYKNILSNAQAIQKYLHITSEDMPITTLPMNYTYGLSIINSHLISGATILLTDRTIMQKEFWQFFKERRATTFGGVPYTYEMLKKLRFFTMDLPHLKYLTQAGGKLCYELTKEYADYCAKKNIDFIVMYGQAEATPRMSYLPAEFALSKCGSIGKAIPGGRFELIDIDNSIIEEPDKEGELVYYGDNVAMGYAECREDLKEGDKWQGRLLTGDIARRDKDGYYYITGRKKRFIKLFGNRVNLDECEQVVKRVVADCACGGVDDKLIIYITDAAMADKVKEYLVQNTAISGFGIAVKVIAAIPKNEAGKTIYAKLQ
jgi:acyl-coenzyme A synthetase/AMP-(fatty) acid ligase